MKSFFRFVLFALVLLVVALVSALTAMRFAIHTREVAVPDLVGKPPAAARSLAEQSGLQMDVERQYYSPNVPEGRILSQVPSAGVPVRRGWRIRVAESLGPQRVQIPDVLGQSARAAQMNIQRRGLDVGSVAQMRLPGAPVDAVLSQSPLPKASGVSAPKISLLVTESPQPQAFVMPSFVGQPLGSVTLILQNAGLHVGVVTMAGHDGNPFSPPMLVAPKDAAGSMVVSQNPSPGEKVVTGAGVNFEVR